MVRLDLTSEGSQCDRLPVSCLVTVLLANVDRDRREKHLTGIFPLSMDLITPLLWIMQRQARTLVSEIAQ